MTQVGFQQPDTRPFPHVVNKHNDTDPTRDHDHFSILDKPERQRAGTKDLDRDSRRSQQQSCIRPGPKSNVSTDHN